MRRRRPKTSTKLFQTGGCATTCSFRGTRTRNYILPSCVTMGTSSILKLGLNPFTPCQGQGYFHWGLFKVLLSVRYQQICLYKHIYEQELFCLIFVHNWSASLRPRPTRPSGHSGRLSVQFGGPESFTKREDAGERKFACLYSEYFNGYPCFRYFFLKVFVHMTCWPSDITCCSSLTWYGGVWHYML